MTSLNDVLLAMSNIPVDDPIAEIWGRGLQGGHEIIEYTGTLPITINADGSALLDYRIYGNTVQTGTPTPENPITPEGVGELETAGTHAGQYKLPILSNSAVTNIYLGEVETTRRIKKLVLTGEEKYEKNYPLQSTNYLYYALRNNIVPGSIDKTPIFCNELPTTVSAPIEIIGINSNNPFPSIYFNFGAEIMNAQPSGNTAAGLKEYLAAQYAAGTPVTVWYVLAEPETGIVNEPLMKIGDYADTISMEQADVSIPTFTGTTIIDYDGTPKPSQMYIKYRRRNAVGEVESTLPITVTADGSALLDYRVYGAEGGVGEKTENLFDIKKVATSSLLVVDGITITKANTAYNYDIFSRSIGSSAPLSTSCMILEAGTYTLSYEIIEGEQNTLAMAACPYTSETMSPETLYYYAPSGMNFALSEKSYVTIRIRQNTPASVKNLMINLGSTALPYEPYGYKLPMLSNSTVIDIYIGDTQLMSDEYADFGEQAAYHKSVPDDVRVRFEQENQVTFADPEAVVNQGNRVRAAVTAVLGEGYTCKEIGTVYSNTDGLCKNDDLFVYRVNGVSIKKGSYTDGRTVRSSQMLDNGYGVKTVGFATISDGTYTTTIYTRILYATYERLHDLGDFTVYPPNTGQNFVPTAVTLPEIPTSEGVTVIDCDMTPKPGKMYVKYRR